jgi:formylglycine-generating enzyme required for sulfatase activity
MDRALWHAAARERTWTLRSVLASMQARPSARRRAFVAALAVIFDAALAARGLGLTSAQEAAPAPGLLRYAGGRTLVGTDVPSARRWISEGGAPDIASETPRHELTLAPFQLMPTEVTNEQFEAFVRATGAQPPLGWGSDAQDAARAAHVEAQSRRRSATGTSGATGASGTASPAGPTGAPPAPSAFRAAAWWDEHWSASNWQVAPEHAALPVVHVGFEAAARYAHWAGLRLMSEAEFQHACRGGGAANYPWGDAFESRRAATWERGIAHPELVASFPDGATREGTHDLIGNVWEWTSSEWSPFPGFKALSVDVSLGGVKQVAQLEPSWDIGWRVTVGGGYDTRRLDARSASRVGLDPAERRPNLGLRCARSLAPAADRIAWWNAHVLGPDARRALAKLDPARGLVAERWQSRVPPGRPAGYAVIDRYDALLAVPVAALDVGSKKALEALAQSAGGSLLIGGAEFTLPLSLPRLEPGVTLLAWRARQPLGTASRSPFGRALPPSSGMEELLFLDRNGDFLGRVNGISVELERTSTLPAELAPAGRAAVSTSGKEARILLRLAIASIVPEQSIVLRAELGIAADLVAGAWSGLGR